MATKAKQRHSASNQSNDTGDQALSSKEALALDRSAAIAESSRCVGAIESSRSISLVCQSSLLRLLQPARQQSCHKSGSRRSLCGSCLCSIVLCSGVAMAFDPCGTAVTRVHRVWVVFQILDVLLFHMADATAVRCLLGRYIQGRLWHCMNLNDSMASVWSC